MTRNISTPSPGPARPDGGAPQLLRDDPQWYRDAIIYQLHVKAFQDSSGDGMGDFRDLRQLMLFEVAR